MGVHFHYNLWKQFGQLRKWLFPASYPAFRKLKMVFALLEIDDTSPTNLNL